MAYIAKFSESACFQLNESDEYKVMTYKHKTCVHVKFRQVTEDTIREYNKHHEQFFLNYISADVSVNRKLVFVFDLIDTNYQSNWKELMRLFQIVHEKYRDTYKHFLLGSIVIVNNSTIKNILTMLFSTVFSPARPVLFCDDNNIKTSFHEIWKYTCVQSH